MKKILAILFITLLFVSISSAQTIERQFELDQGWNTISADIQDISFSEDIKPECSFGWYNQQLDEKDPDQIDEEDRYYVWTQEGGDWENPDSLKPEKGYTVFLTQESCSFTLEGEVENFQNIEIGEGWNLVNLRSERDVQKTMETCGESPGLRWYNTDIEQGSAIHLDEEQRYYFWINNGNQWNHPYQEEDHSIKPTDGVYINSQGNCEIELETREAPELPQELVSNPGPWEYLEFSTEVCRDNEGFEEVKIGDEEYWYFCQEQGNAETWSKNCPSATSEEAMCENETRQEYEKIRENHQILLEYDENPYGNITSDEIEEVMKDWKTSDINEEQLRTLVNTWRSNEDYRKNLTLDKSEEEIMEDFRSIIIGYDKDDEGEIKGSDLSEAQRDWKEGNITSEQIKALFTFWYEDMTYQITTE